MAEIERVEFLELIGLAVVIINLHTNNHGIEARSVTFVNSDGVEQLTRYLDLLNRDPLLAPVRGIFAAQEIKPQAKVLAVDRGIECVTLDYDALRGIERDGTLF